MGTCAYVGMHTAKHMWRSEDKLQEMAISFYHVNFGNPAQVVMPGVIV